MKTSLIEKFRLPRYNEIPNVGLYLDQVTKYIDDYLKPIGDSTTNRNIKIAGIKCSHTRTS